MEIYNDFNTSVEKALEEIDPNYRDYKGVVVCGQHDIHKTDSPKVVSRIRLAREAGLPFLGICFGHQMAAVEYAKNVLGIAGATSAEIHLITDMEKPMPEFVVRKRKGGLKVGLHDGETYWNNYEVIDGFEEMWNKADNFITCQYHPEYQSSKDKPHPLLVKFLEYAKMATKSSS